MRGKYEKKKQKKSAGKQKLLWILVIVLLVVVAAVFAISVLPENPASSSEDTVPPSIESTAKTETPIMPSSPPKETTLPKDEEYLFSIDRNIKIKEISSYTGPYMEDGSDDAVENIMQILVKNIGEEPLQYAKIALVSDTEEAVFEMTTLMPGATMIVLEANRKAYSESATYSKVRADNIAYFQYVPSVQEEKLLIQPLDGGFNIKNISGENIDSRIVIYFKDYANDVYIGGITYSGTIKDGLKADEIKQIMSNNFSASTTKIMFINIG